ncbi:hypothetical protein ACH4KT_33350 [Streptomyces anulatus]
MSYEPSRPSVILAELGFVAGPGGRPGRPGSSTGRPRRRQRHREPAGGERFDVDRITTWVRAALDDARYQAEFERGSTLAPEEHLKDPLL